MRELTVITRYFRCACLEGLAFDCNRWVRPVWPMCPRGCRDHESHETAADKRTMSGGMKEPSRSNLGLLGQSMGFGFPGPGEAGW